MRLPSPYMASTAHRAAEAKAEMGQAARGEKPMIRSAETTGCVT